MLERLSLVLRWVVRSGRLALLGDRYPADHLEHAPRSKAQSQHAASESAIWLPIQRLQAQGLLLGDCDHV